VTPVLPSPQLARYADALVRVAAGIRPDDVLIVGAEPAHRELCVALVSAAYRVGARHAEVQYVDPFVRAAQLREAPEASLGWLPPWRVAQLRERERPDLAALYLMGETEPQAYRGVDPARAALERSALSRQLPWVDQPRRSARRRFAYVPWATEAWATRVYPELEPLRAQRRLARDLLRFCRIGPGDPPGWSGLDEHLTALQGRADRLSGLGLRRLELRAPGTELTVELPTGTLFLGPRERTSHGVAYAPNVPTEEVATSPDAASTEGTFRCTRPIRLEGRLVDGLHGEFRGGRLVRLDAKGRAGRFLRSYLGAVANADRLGEVALVDASSRIGRARRTYFHSLIDENAVAHIAFGAAFPETRTPQSRGRGLNRSDLHLDVMIGSDDLEATGLDGRNRRIPLIRDGAWQV
jgi:aminopeptidase